MKIKYLSYILLLTTIFVYSCSRNKTDDEIGNCGVQLFQLLKSFNPDDKQKFAAGFASFKTIHKIGNDKYLIWADQKEYANMSQSEYETEIIDNPYTTIKYKGNAFDIVWNKIEFIKYIYQEQGRNSFVLDNEEYKSPEWTKGILVFRYNRKLYDVECIYIKYDNAWHLLSITRLVYRV